MMKLNKLLLTATVFVQAVLPGFAQVDTTYFDRDWEETTKDKAVYFRPQPQKVGKYYEVRDYYMSTGKMQMQEYCLDSNLSISDSVSIWYFENGVMQHEYFYVAGKIKGMHTTYYDNGVKASECTHTGKDFPRKHYRRSGELWFVERYNKMHKYDGERIYYYPGGKIERKERWKNGRFKEGECYTKEGADTSYFTHRNYPVFKGGYNAYRNYENSHLRYNNNWRAAQLDGDIHMEIKVDKEGKLISVETKNGAHPILDAEARRFLYSIPEWEPALDEDYQPVEGTAAMTFTYTAIGAGAFILTPIDFILYYVIRGFD